MKVQHGGHMRRVENKPLKSGAGDENSGSAEFSGLERGVTN
jgi:hypothetical protein